jgi:hypothetical protein
MPGFEKGQTFLDRKALDLSGTKPKYFIALTDAEDADDEIICFVMNTENMMDRYHFECNKKDLRFIIRPGTFSFIDRETSIMLNKEVYYTFKELCNDNIKLLETANDLLVRQIRNCIDWNFMMLKTKRIIDHCFR